jgi:hypothetical protein
MKFREKMIVCCENRTKYIDVPCQKNSAFLNIKVSGVYIYVYILPTVL